VPLWGKFVVVGRNKLLLGLMEVRIWDIGAIDHVLLWHSFVRGNCQHRSEEVNERGEEHTVLVPTKKKRMPLSPQSNL